MKIYAVVDDESDYLEDWVVGHKWFKTLDDAKAYRKAQTDELVAEWDADGNPFDEDEIAEDMFYSIFTMDLF